MLKFDLREGEVIRKVKHIGYAQQIDDKTKPVIEKYMVWSALKLLNHLGLLPRGYFTRVVNGNISYDSCKRYIINTMYHKTNYGIYGKVHNGKVYLALTQLITKETNANS